MATLWSFTVSQLTVRAMPGNHTDNVVVVASSLIDTLRLTQSERVVQNSKLFITNVGQPTTSTIIVVYLLYLPVTNGPLVGRLTVAKCATAL